MFKKITSSFLAFIFLCLTSGLTPDVFAAPTSFLTAPSAVLIDGMSGRLIYSKSPHMRRPQASTTKIMTAMVVLDRANLNDVVLIPKSVMGVQPSKLYLKGGERYYVKDLIYAILLKSANDAAEALAIHIAGSVPAFCRLMDAKAKSMGAKNTRFKTPNGLPAKGQYSTTYDLALIMKQASKYPFLMDVLTAKAVTIKSLGGRLISMKSHNKMLWSEKYDVVGKTGYTKGASYCFMGRIDEKYKGIYLGLLGSKSLWKDVRRLCSYPSAKMLSVIKVNQKHWARNDIQSMQQLLLNAGYDAGSPSGDFTLKTLVAIESFQKDHGISPDGVVRDQTYKTLLNYR